jgi:succinoglycan biosynthesis protein ExoA
MISVICPVFNEEHFIRQLLDFFLTAQPAEKEFILVDGGSADHTVAVIKEYQQLHHNIILLHNKNKFVPFALNLAIKEAKGNIIIRLDAHCRYAENYFTAIIDCFERTGADIVGGPTRTAFSAATQEAVAYAICTKLAVGDSRVHQLNYEGLTDSVTFGAWKKNMFEVTGVFDEDLLRNQDDEFHYRAGSKGFKLWQDPSICLYYYPRKDIKGLFKQYFGYGLYKPLVLKKVRQGMKVRHLVPASFCLYCLMLPFSFVFPLLLFPGFIYLLLIGITTLQSGKALGVQLRLLAVYPTIHLAYGSGFIKGIFKKL